MELYLTWNLKVILQGVLFPVEPDPEIHHPSAPLSNLLVNKSRLTIYNTMENQITLTVKNLCTF